MSSDLAVRYEAAIRHWAELTRHRTSNKVDAANRLVEESQRLYLELRQDAEGRRLMERLAADPDRLVRLTAATHCLHWNPQLGRSALEQIRGGTEIDGPGWDEAGFDAKWTLKALDKGDLNLDWEPKRR